MRCRLGFLAVLLCASTVTATVDPDPDQLGVYFDLDADENCLTIEPSVPFFAYITITNPSAAEVHGLECSYRLAIPEGFEGLLFRLAAIQPVGICDPTVDNTDPSRGEYIIGLASPLPGNGSNVTFIQWQFMLLENFTVDFYLGPSFTPSLPNGLPLYEFGGALQPLGVSSGDVNLPVASVNGDCRAVRTETTNFGSVKSLYR